MYAPRRIFIPPEDGCSREGFTENMPLMPNLEEWVGFID